MPDNRPQWLQVSQPFVVGGVAGSLATCVIQPIDIVKVRIQLSDGHKNPFRIASNLVKNEGWLGFYKGLDAGIVRQLTYTTTRLGVFRLTSNFLTDEGKPLPFYKKAFAGLFAGGIGAFVGTPADLALVRMQADNLLPLAERRNYAGVSGAVRSIIRSDGVFGLWKGSLPTVTRAMALNCGMLASFDQGKEFFSEFYGSKGYYSVLTASAVSGFMAAFVSLPFDFVKSKIQSQSSSTSGPLYKGSVDCAIKVVRKSGFTSLWTGFPTYYFRIAPHAMLVLLLVDYINEKCLKAFE